MFGTKKIAVGIVSLYAQFAFGQTSSGSLTGTVLDSQNAAIANATVIIIDTAKQTEQRTVTETSGRFAFPTLSPSTYDISIEQRDSRNLNSEIRS